MNQNIRTAIKDTIYYLYLALKALWFWRREPPVTTVAELVKYVETRSKFVSQTTLYSYIKTRAGTRYVSLFEDETFVRSINIAKWEIYLACLCDLAVWAAARAGGQAAARDAETEALAVHIVDSATGAEQIPPERPGGFDDICTGFRQRAASTAWNRIEDPDAPFAGSLDALVHWAPIADELKMHDTAIIRNSMRFKWKKVRDQLDKLLDGEAVISDWRSRGGA